MKWIADQKTSQFCQLIALFLEIQQALLTGNNTMTKNETLREIVAHRQDLHGLASDCPDISAAIVSTRAALTNNQIIPA